LADGSGVKHLSAVKRGFPTVAVFARHAGVGPWTLSKYIRELERVLVLLAEDAE